MLFSSLEFIFIFFPLSLIIYYLSPERMRNLSLLLLSLFFYAWSSARVLPLMLGVIVINYAIGLAIGSRFRHEKGGAKLLLWIGIALDISLLFFFKYASVLSSWLSKVTVFSGLPGINLPLPVGISFYTFQAISYLSDVYRRECEAQKNPIKFATYISLYPQLVAGPIVRYGDVANALEKGQRRYCPAEGIERFVFGLGKKMLLANQAGEIWRYVSTLPDIERTALSAWLGMICFAFQIYFDFSAYSDMAIGLGKFYGFDFPENFNYPYICRSISDFWRRWHMTLTDFFRSYVYIPLGGNRRGKRRMYFNMLLVWGLTGLWHGASVNFIFWGIYYFVLLAFERSLIGKWTTNHLPRIIYRIFALFAVLMGWLLFACDKPGMLGGYIASMFSAPIADGIAVYDSLRLIPFLVICGFFSTPLPRKAFEKLRAKRPLAGALIGFSCLVLSVGYLVNSSYNPFLYFRF